MIKGVFKPREASEYSTPSMKCAHDGFLSRELLHELFSPHISKNGYTTHYWTFQCERAYLVQYITIISQIVDSLFYI